MTSDLIVRAELVEDWIASHTSRETRATYRHGIGEYFAWVDARGLDVFTLRRPDVDRYRIQLVETERLGNATVAKRLSTVSSFYDYVIEDSPLPPIEHSPVARVKRPKVSRDSRRDGLEVDEAVAVLAASLRAGPRQAAVVHLLLTTGVRVSEACSATTDDLAAVGGERYLTVVRKGGMSSSVRLSPDCCTVLDNYLSWRPQGPTGPILVSQRGAMSRQLAFHIVRDIAREVLGLDRRIGPHALRRTAATLLLNAGVPLQEVQAMLGHSDPRTTQIYDRDRAGRGARASRALDGVLSGAVS